MRRLEKAFKFIHRFEVSLFLGWILAIHAFEAVILPSLQLPTQLLSQFSLKSRLWEIWAASSDGPLYMDVARNGYLHESRTIFPLWPILIRVLGTSPALAKLAAIALTFIFIILFSNLIKKLGYSKSSKETLIAFLLLPSSFLLAATLSEPLFLALAAATFMFSERKKFGWAAICAGLASGTRVVGIILTIYLAIKLWEAGPKTLARNFWILFISPMGFLLYALFLKITLGDFALFYKDQTGWGRSLGLQAIQNFILEQINVVGQILGPFKPIPVNLMHFLLLFFLIFLAVISFKKLGRALWIYSVAVIALPLASGTTVAISRYLLAAFPLFLPFGQFLQKHKFIFYFYLFFAMLFQSYLLIRFFNFEVAD